MMALRLCSKSALLLILHTVLFWRIVKAEEAVFSDNHGHCTTTTPFRMTAENEHFRVRSVTFGNDYETLDCRLPFQAQAGDGVCLKFDEFFIDDCGVSLQIYKGFSLNKESLWKMFVCHDPNPSEICTTERDVTLRILKENQNKNTGYSFDIIIGENAPTVASASRTVFDSTGFIILFVIAVIFVLTMLALILWCCCFSSSAIATTIPKKSKPEYESHSMPSARARRANGRPQRSTKTTDFKAVYLGDKSKEGRDLLRLFPTLKETVIKANRAWE